MSQWPRLVRVMCASLLLAACADAPKPVDRVQTNLVDKGIFEGEWWYASTSIDVDYDEAFVFNSANAGAPFNGSMSTDYGLDFNRGGPSVLGAPVYSFPIARIRWVIDEKFLFAYRSYELVSGANLDARSPDFRGQPLAVFAISDHVDVRKDYDPVTGETNNVTMENTQDARWYDRKFMRVDWSQNLLTNFVGNDVQSNELFTSFRREPVPFFVQSGSHDELPDSYQPQFVRVRDDENYARKNEWSADQADVVHYMSFVTQEVWSPASGCVTQGGTCASATATMRNAFLRIPDKHEYAAQTETNAEFDRFGLWRSHQPTYAAGAQDRAVQHKHCDTDADCGVAGSCDTAERRAAECEAAGKPSDCREEQNICIGGLTADQGETDFLNYFTSRLNFFEDSLTDKECIEDWECDGRYAECASGDADCSTQQLSRCDLAARRCTTPVTKRAVKPVTFRLSPHFPPYLVRQVFESMAEWNVSFMAGLRATRGYLPFDQSECSTSSTGVCTTDLSREGRVTCQRSNPTAFCYCGSPDDQGGTCRRDYDAFETPDAARERGVPNPYDCYVEGPADVEHPEDFSEYNGTDAYAYRFRGSECMLQLAVNSCDLDPKQPCEELGDLRYSFITHLQHGGANFAGVALPRTDPTNGEVITANAVMAAESLESIGNTASQFFPVLRGEAPEDSFFVGDNVRGYFANLGKVEHPVTSVPVVGEGNEIADPSRPTRPAGSDAAQSGQAGRAVNKAFRARVDAALVKAKGLQGPDGRAAIKSDRLQKLRGTAIETQLATALSSELPNDDSQVSTANVTSATTSPLDLDTARKQQDQERQRRLDLGARNMDVFDAKLFNSQYLRYYADRFAGKSSSESSLRMQQAYFKSVALHEIGHVLGLRHNFAGSLDRNNYHDAYFKLASQTPLPNSVEYDDPTRGGNGDQTVTGAEADSYARDVRGAREERLKSGAGTVMSSSVMDYAGDLSDYSGLGRYDRAAVTFAYFDKVEAYETGDPTASPQTTAAQSTSANASIPVAFAGLERPDLHRRELWTYYRGGETCRTDSDCPFHVGREGVAYQAVTQRCVVNPRLPDTTRAACAAGGCVCSNIYDDFDAYMGGSAYRASSSGAAFSPVKYLFCHDNRVNDLSWCTPNDAGESFSEVVEHYRRTFLERYPRDYFRHFNANGPRKGASYTAVVDAVKIYQHMFFRLNYEGDEYYQSLAPLGLQDQLTASVATLDWLSSIIGAPDVGSYQLDTRDNVYRQISHDPGVSGSNLDLGIGQGFYLWSEYQTGQNGFFRLERAGTFLDKIQAIEALARRDWGLTYQVDEFFYVNYFDFFPKEIVDLFGGLIARNPHQYAPRYLPDGNIEYLSSLRGQPGGGTETRANQETTYPQPAIDGTDTETLRDWATIQALSEFPVYYDTSFEQRLLVYKLGSGDGYKIPDTRRDGTPTCRYGAMGCAQPDYIVYESDRLHTSYVAVVIDPEETNRIDEQQVAYQLLRRLTDRQARIRDLTGQASRTDAEQAELTRDSDDLQRDESYLEYLIELERQLGISSYFF